MKKAIVFVFVLVMTLALSISASAATGINENEQAVLDMLKSGEVIGANGWSFSINPDDVNTAENYFAGDCDMTAQERDVILDCIEQGAEILKAEADAQGFKGAEYKLSNMSKEARSKVLELGVKACAELDLNLVYNAAENQVIITPVGSNTPVFESTPVVKTTGESFPLTAGGIGVAITAVLVLGAVAIVVVSKKNGLFAK